MKHIQQNRCGYGGVSGYECVGVPTLNSMFSSLGLTCDSVYDRDDDWESDIVSPIDYDRLRAYAEWVGENHMSPGYPWSGQTCDWIWGNGGELFNTMFPLDQDKTLAEHPVDVRFAAAMSQWISETFHTCSGDCADASAPFNTAGVDRVVAQQVVDTFFYFLTDYFAWKDDEDHQASDRPKFQDYVLKYMHPSNFIDNYLNLPVKFRGFVVKWDHVLMMDPGNQVQYFTPPEVECRTDLDASQPSGFIDLFNKAFFFGRVDACAATGGGSSPYVLLANHLVCFSSGIFEPGLIEPPLPAEHDMPQWPVLTPTSAGLDGLGLGLVNVNQWQNIVNLWLNDTGRSLMHLWAIREMMLNIATNDRNDDFTIKRTSGDSMWWDTSADSISYPHFTVRSGTAQVNGTDVSVSSYSYNAGSSFTHVYFYLNFTLENCDTDGRYGSVRASISTSRRGDFSVGLGSITRLTVSRQNGRPLYYLYQIYQERNTVSIELVRTCKEGVLWRLTSGASPYKVIDVTEC